MDVGSVRFDIQTLKKDLICRSDRSLESVISRFTSSHTPLFAMDNKGKFVGMLTIKNSLLNRRHGPLSLISSCLIEAPKISKETEAKKILKLMNSMRLYSLPVMDKKNKIVGIVEIKNILKKLFENKVFLDNLVEELPKRNIITIGENGNVGQAFSIFFKKNISRLAVVDKDNKIIGIVTKRDILSAYFAPSDKQRFSTREIPKNYSFDEEKIYRDDQLITEFMSPIVETVYKDSKTETVLRRLMNSRFNAIVLVDRNKKAFYIMTLRDVLKSTVDILERDEGHSNIVINFPDKFGLIRKIRTKKIIESLFSWIDKKEKIQVIRFVIKTSKTVNKKVDRFEMRLVVRTDKDEYVSSTEGRNFLAATREAVDQIKKQAARSD